MAKEMSNIDIREYEGGDFAKIDDNYTDRQIQAAIANRAEKAFETFEDLKEEVEELKNNPDVVDIVATYADLQAYDTQHLTDKDIIRVLADENHDGESTYYRYSKQGDSWTYIGTVGDYYTKTAADAKFQNKLTAGSNITIDANNEISATDTTYSAFTGTDGTSAGTAGLVPAPATTDAGKFLKADGTWDTAGGGGDTVYSTVTTSNSSTGGAVYIGDKDTNQNVISDPSSTDNNYKYFWALPASTNGNTYGKPAENSVNIMGSSNGANTVSIGYSAGMGSYGASGSVRIGADADAGNNGVAVGFYSGSNQNHSYCVNIGSGSRTLDTGVNYAVGLGAFSIPTRTGEVNVGLYKGHESGFNGSIYRVIGGVYDGQTAHDAATVGQLDGRVLQNAGAPTTATVGTVGQLLEDTTNGKLYQCTAVSGNTYTWSEVGAGGGGGSTMIELTAADMNANSNDWSDTDPTNFNCIALWKLPYGVYCINNAALPSADKIPVYCHWYMDSFDTTYSFGSYITAPYPGQNGDVMMFCFGSPGSSNANYGAYMLRFYRAEKSTGAPRGDTYSAATYQQIKEEFFTGEIDATPTTSTWGIVGRLYRYNNNGTYELWICLDDSGGTYTWKQVNLT